ncbi:hypothetical protein CFP56_030642 [Quercus suber]|uniref:Uncharacterized protein n=1 Tax=Quercus suber TaxID=58331 RepID=A0AAW0LWM6_QUESU
MRQPLNQPHQRKPAHLAWVWFFFIIIITF